MTIKDLLQALEGTAFPVSLTRFLSNPNPPYICVLVSDSSNMFADNTVYKEFENIQIVLYTSKKDLAAEGKVKAVLNGYYIPYQTSQTYIESEDLFKMSFEVMV
jgi:hypothetical protein